MDFLTFASNRYSCRTFKDQPVEQEKIDKLVEAIKIAPTAHNNQPQRVWICQSQEALERIRQCTKCHFDAPLVLIVGYKKDEAWVRPYDGKQYGEVDSAIVGSHIILTCEGLGLGCTWVAHYNPAKIAEFFPETEGYEIVSLFPMGYPTEDAHAAKMHSVYRDMDEIITVL